MTNPNDRHPNEQDPRKTTIDQDGRTIDAEVVDVEAVQGDVNPQTEDADTDAEDFGDFDPSNMDPSMFAGVQEMMEKLQRSEELERENNDLRGRLGRLAADFESFRRRTSGDADEARAKGRSEAAEALMPVYDDLTRALEMGSGDPAKLIPGMQAVQQKVLSVFGGLGLEATGQVGETFDPQWHEALQVVPGDDDNTVTQVYQQGFRMGERLVRPARVVVSQKG